MQRFFKLSVLALVVILLSVYTAVLPGKGQEVNSPQIVPGPWGNIVDPVTPQVLQSDAERITFYRRQQMRALSAHFRSLEGIIEYDAPFKQQALQHVEALNKIAQYLPDLFPPGTAAEVGQTGANPLIWQQSEKFAQHIQGFQESIVTLQSVLGRSTWEHRRPMRYIRPDISRSFKLSYLKQPTDADTSAALMAVRHQCLACHQFYRVR